MEAIEEITSQTKTVVETHNGQEFEIEIPIWNPTIANLTLMALGSSAPEILLSIIETMQTLGQPAGELGPSTIVGSASFNLLVISGVSIMAVSDEPKKIFDLGVFSITSCFSLFAYIWLFICLQDDVIDVIEAWLTLFFFFLLIGLSFAADKFNQSRRNSVNTLPENENEIEIEKKVHLSKGQLRTICKQIGEQSVIQIAQGKHSDQFNEIDQSKIKELFMEVLRLRDPKELSNIPLDVLSDVVKPECPVERIGAKKANKLA